MENPVLLEGKDVLTVIPQRPPFVMIDKLVLADGENTVARFTVKAGNELLEGNQLSEAAMIECVAQTAAAGVGYQCVSESKKVPVGFIGAVKRLKLSGRPDINDEISITVKVLTQVMNATVVEGKIGKGEEMMLQCELNIFLQQGNQK